MPPGGSEKMNQPRPFPWRSVGSITPEQRMRIRGLLDQAAAFKKDVESVDAAEEASALLNSKGIINNEIWRDRCDPDNLLRIRTFFDGRPYAALVAMLKDSNPAAYEELTLLYMGAAVALETRHQAKLLGTTPLRPESPAGKAAETLVGLRGFIGYLTKLDRESFAHALEHADDLSSASLEEVVVAFAASEHDWDSEIFHLLGAYLRLREMANRHELELPPDVQQKMSDLDTVVVPLLTRQRE